MRDSRGQEPNSIVGRPLVTLMLIEGKESLNSGKESARLGLEVVRRESGHGRELDSRAEKLR